MANFNKSDLAFILEQIRIAEKHAAGIPLTEQLPNSFVPFGLRTLTGKFNNLYGDQEQFGAADGIFPRLLDPVFRNDQDGDSIDLNGPAPGGVLTNTNYASTGNVVDADPRLISNLIVDQTANNPAAVAANGGAPTAVSPGLDGVFGTADDKPVFFIPNTAPDEGLSAGFNSWFTFFGQFFDHGLDLTTKGGNGAVFVPLQPDDPLYVIGGNANFMVLTRATQVAGPGADGVLGTADDTSHEAVNTTSPFVDQNQTYSSHPSHQVFLRAYQLNAAGDPVSTGKLITNRDLGADGRYGTADDLEIGGMATWAVVKAQAHDLLGINLTDADVGNVPLLATDDYGNFLRGPNGFPQVVFPGNTLVEGNPAAPISLVGALRTGHSFLEDIAHAANPFSSTGAALLADTDTALGLSEAGRYDNELLDKHYIAGDGRVNENIGLTAVHAIFHSEHNRLVEQNKGILVQAAQAGDLAFLNEWLLTPVVAVPADLSTLVWNGERLFQAAKFGTEMQYQHLVFEEFARKVQPNVDAFLAPEGFDTTINAAIVAEFAHTVYRFGHSMLTETVDRFDANFDVVGDGNPTQPLNQQTGLIAAFLNPLAFAASGVTPEQATGALVRGLTRQAGNEIDEFVTEALRNNLVGLPLDLAALNIARGRDTGIPSLNAARREFYAMTSDGQLKPYISWVDLMEHLKNPESVINFIAAYGTHTTILAATTLVGKRAAAADLVLGGGTAPGDRLDFLNSTGAYANLANGVTITGVDDIDFWIGGLAERQMPFGGLLGSSFNFVFETQMEALQNGDRFYYLSRTAGMNFATELENNSFAKLVMLNSDATHLPADIFSTPGFILEVNQSLQFTGLGALGRDDPTVGGSDLVPLVIRDDLHTPGVDTNYLRYTGDQHVVLGGTNNNDTLIASEGDDTIWGDGGNDRIEGGDGNDRIEGGDGNDIITDRGGDDVLKGNGGNDVIQGGNGLNILFGGDGSDFIITGEDVSTTFGGQGNDFILGSQMNLPTLGNEGDDWIEIGTSDGAGGDNFDPLEAGTIIGNDVFITGGGFDEADGEGGDDIMVFSDGEDHFGGGGGFDWASYANDTLGVSANLLLNDFIEPPVAPSNQGLRDRFAQVEGLSGSAFGDILRGDDADALEIGAVGPQNSTLTNIALITGLQAFLNQALGTPTTSFNGGNIIFGGGGSDLIEGRGGDDLIDGDRWLNVRVAVSNDANGNPPPVSSVKSLTELIPYMLSGAITPGQLSIAREVLTGAAGYDTAMFSDVRANYTVATTAGVTTVTHLNAGADGTDRLVNVERLQFSDQAVVLAGGNNGPVGVLTLNDTSPSINQVLTASPAGISDADNPGAITGPISYIWQSETLPGTGIFQDIVDFGGGAPATAHGNTFRVTPDLDGVVLRVRAVYQDANGVMENVFSAPTLAVAGSVVLPPTAAIPLESATTSTGIHLIRADLQFILDQIKVGEANSGAYGTPSQDILSLIPNSRLPFGLRTVDGSFNNLVRGQTEFGAADNNFPSLLDQVFRNDADGDTIDLNGPAPGGVLSNTNYATTGPSAGHVVDADPRTISNLIVDQTITNPAAVQAFVDGGLGVLADGTQFDVTTGLPFALGTLLDLNGAAIPAGQPLFIPNTAPDAGLSAGFNSWFTLFGQFFDHGLDLVNKGNNGTVFIPLEPDDPLYVPGGNSNFMVLTRADNIATNAGVDEVFNTADDVHLHNNQTTPFVDQNQTYTAHPSHQVFLREYALDASGKPVATGQLLNGSDGGLPTWADVKAQARNLLGIALDDYDLLNLPLLATDAYGKFIPDPITGMAQIVTVSGLQSGTPGAPIDASLAGRTGHAFLDDIAHSASPKNSQGVLLLADDDNAIGLSQAGRYDNELLDRHFATGDGRGNENIGLTTVHHIFHSEHNRMVAHTKDVILASNDPAFIAQWLMPGANQADGIQALEWNGERLFQAARFSTEMQYQHLVFEEFARKVQPNVDVFLMEGQGYDSTINPAIVAEFAHVVYRFGHSMLTETVDRLDPNFVSSEMGLIEAFLNPIAFNNNGALTPEQAAGAIVRGMTRQQANEIDEFVTEALRNNLLGLPLDLATINLARGRDTGVPSFNAARREFFNATGDSQLTPYSSWVDLAANLRHESSVINFIAAYGKHAALTATDVNTMAEKRAVALALVMGGNAVINQGTVDERTFVADTADRIAFLNGTGIYANLASGVTITGVDDIDLWVGGLAEKQMPFGGLLGSTFNYVFENQMEKLQNGDRFYYLERTAGLNFLTELENNSFAKLIMANTDATHLAGDVFSTPAFTLEVDPTKQYTGLGVDGRADPTHVVASVFVADLVIRNDPTTAGPDTHYLRYTGVDHVVLGGTSGNDTLIASIGDDTLYGDGGNDRLDAGDGVDMVLGGDGDDIITDLGGDDNLQGGNGNDAIHGGNGINLILAGYGNDFVVTGEDSSEVFGGGGNDFLLGVRANEMVFGNEGDDWLELGMADGSAGENFDTRGLDSIIGNDVFMGDSVSDRMLGEGGDDIMVGNGGRGDRYMGGSGFDWAGFQHASLAADADLLLRAFDETPVVPSAASVLARYESIEGLSGSAHSDILRGDDANAAAIAVSGFTGSRLTNIGLIAGLQDVLGAGVTSFDSGNIILGGNGSDIIEGRGGNDLIDGDKALHVRISVRANADGTGAELRTANSMTELVQDVFSGAINPGQLQIVREIRNGDGSFNFDTAVFSGRRAEYDVEGFQAIGGVEAADLNGDGYITVAHLDPVDPTGATIGVDGIDRIARIERMQFSDQSVVLVQGLNAEPTGLVTINDTTPEVGTVITASIAGVTDGDNPGGVITGPIAYFWQIDLLGLGVFEDIIIATGVGEERVTGPNLTVTPDLAGFALRVRAVYQDAHGVIETVFSAPTALTSAVSVNDAPTIAASVAITTNEDTSVSSIAVGSDADTTNGDVLSYSATNGTNGAVTINSASGAWTYAPAANTNGADSFTITVTDSAGATAQQVVSVSVTAVNDAPAIAATASASTTEDNSVSGTALGSDVDVATNGDVLSYSATNGTNGAVIINSASGAWTYAPAANTNGADSFTITVTDSAGATAQQVVSMSVTAVNDAPVGAVTIDNATPSLSQTLTAANTLTDVDGIASAIGYQWQSLVGATWTNIAGATGSSFITTTAQSNQQLRVQATYLDGGGTTEIVTSAATVPVFAFNIVTGTDSAETLNGTAVPDQLTALAGNDILEGFGGNDWLLGGAGNDWLNGGTGFDTMEGGADNDTYVVDNNADSAVEGVDAGTDTVRSYIASYALTSNVENLMLMLTGTASGTGNSLANVITAGAGNNIMDGGLGTDTVSYALATGGVTVSLGLAGVQATGGSGSDTLLNVENLTGSGLADNLTGNGTANVLIGAAGNDILEGLGGNDSLHGGAGSDWLNGGGGIDILDGGAEGDTYIVDNNFDAVIEGIGAGTDTVRSYIASHTLAEIGRAHV